MRVTCVYTDERGDGHFADLPDQERPPNPELAV
jgi:hypothetical protein